MAEKDKIEKTLEGYSDVFADIVNGLLFDGREVICESDVKDADVNSIYKADSKIHGQERDTVKYWQNGEIRLSVIGFENQTVDDPDMPLRVLSYDAASYRNEMNAAAAVHMDKSEKKSSRYPVVTLVLYFGHDHRWRHPVNLKQCLEIPDELDRYVSDYRINLFEIAWLTDEQVSMFRSDFKIIADYFVQIRKNKKYEPSTETINHVREILNLMSVLTNDNRFEEACNSETKEGGPTNMCEVLDEVENRGIAKGIEKGIAKGIKKGKETGREEKQKEVAVKLYQMNMSEKKIAEIVDSDAATVHMWLQMEKDK